MGQTPKALRCVIWVDEDYAAEPQIQALVDKGHTVLKLDPRATPDEGPLVPRNLGGMPHLILSRTAHQWTPEMFKIKGLLDVAMKSTRDRKRGK